jgi:hypothetical protein
VDRCEKVQGTFIPPDINFMVSLPPRKERRVDENSRMRMYFQVRGGLSRRKCIDTPRFTGMAAIRALLASRKEIPADASIKEHISTRHME